MAVLHARIPEDRMGVLIGPGGETKRAIEKQTGAKVEIDPEEGEIRVSAPDEADPGNVLKARDIVVAIGRGFSPERAFRLLRDDSYLGLVDIKGVSGKRGKKSIWRIRSRLIGEHGRARERLEELSGCWVSIYGNTVALIGKEPQLVRATKAVELLLHGSEHNTVFHMLARQRSDDAREAALLPSSIDGDADSVG
jgi:ribosomal RNA assembly protein